MSPGEWATAERHWKLARNCSLAPKQLWLVFVALSMVSLAVAVFFWLMGAPMVMPFACLELAALGVAFFSYARHAGDAEWIAIEGDQLRVARCHGGRWSYWQACRLWVRVGLSQNGLVELSAAGRSLQLGALASSGHRQRVVKEVRQALLARATAAV
jgi:uncharacterized membrane protein